MTIDIQDFQLAQAGTIDLANYLIKDIEKLKKSRVPLFTSFLNAPIQFSATARRAVQMGHSSNRPSNLFK